MLSVLAAPADVRGVARAPCGAWIKLSSGRGKIKARARHVPGAAVRTVKRAESGMGRRRAPELYRAPFPLYALQVDPSTGLLIAAGGGGAAKTGIKNGVVRAQGHWGRVTPRAEGDSRKVAGAGCTPFSDPAPPRLKSPACGASRREFQPRTCSPGD